MKSFKQQFQNILSENESVLSSLVDMRNDPAYPESDIEKEPIDSSIKILGETNESLSAIISQLGD